MQSASVDISKDRLELGPDAAARAQLAQFAGGGVVVVVLAVGLMLGGESLLRGYVTALCYCLSIALGALFFVMLQHVTRAGWSVVVRRMAEAIAMVFPLLALLALPIVIAVLTGLPEAVHKVYPWTDPEYVRSEALLQHKAAYLNAPLFVLRMLLYFALWTALARYLYNRSVEQDRTGDPQITIAVQKVSAPGIILFALSLTFCAFDLLMSLAPTWYSTIFGVYFFSGSVLGFFATLALMMFALQSRGLLREAITIEHYHDVGKLAFGFVVFWAYIAFSQYMLYWYANMPETTSWYIVRQSGAWLYLSLLLLFGHFMVPFVGLISRIPKRRRWALGIGAGWILVMHWFDIAYLALPPYFFKLDDPNVVPFDGLALGLGLLLTAGMLLLLGGAVVRRLSQACLVPKGDPRLEESLAFENL